MRLVRILAMLAVAMAATLAAAATASAATCTGFGYLTTSTGTLQRFSTATNAVTAGTDLVIPGAQFTDVAVAPDGRSVYTVDTHADRLYVIDTATNTLRQTVSGFNAPTAIAFSPDGTRAYIVNKGSDTFSVVDTSSLNVIGTYTAGTAPRDAVVSADGTLLYVTAGTDLTARSTTTGAVQTTYALGGSARAVARSATTVYTARDGIDSMPFAVSAALLSGSTASTLFSEIPGAGAPWSVAVSPDGTMLYVGTGAMGRNSLVAGPTAGGLLSPIGNPGSTEGRSIAVSPDGATVYAAGGTVVTVTDPAGLSASTVSGAVTNAIEGVAICPTVPGAPTTVAATPGDTVVSLRWTAPMNTGGAQITAYTATAAPGDATCTTTGATTCLFTGLKNGTKYSFTVTATNPVGPSAASVASTKVTPRRDNAARVLAVGLPTITFAKRGIRIATTITVAGAGTIAQVASFKRTRYCTVSRRVTKAGTYRVRCVINTAGRDLARIRAVSYTLRSTFSPKNGLVASNSQTVRVPRRR